MIMTISCLYYSFLQNTARLRDKILNFLNFGVEPTLTRMGITISSLFMLKLKVASAPLFEEQRIVYFVTCDSFICNFSSYLFMKMCKCRFQPYIGLFV